MICVVCLFAFSSNNYVKAASTTVREAYNVCQGQEEWYTIDNDYTTGQEWWVEGGEIIEYSFFGTAHTDQRYPNYWNFWATGSQVVCFPFVACQDYANEANRGDLRPSRIKIKWTGQGQGIVKCRARDYGWMSTQHAYDGKVITIYGTPTTQQTNSFYLTGNANPNCDQYTSIRPVNLPEYYGANYTWNVPAEAVEDGKNKYNLNI